MIQRWKQKAGVQQALVLRGHTGLSRDRLCCPATSFSHAGCCHLSLSQGGLVSRLTCRLMLFQMSVAGWMLLNAWGVRHKGTSSSHITSSTCGNSTWREQHTGVTWKDTTSWTHGLSDGLPDLP